MSQKAILFSPLRTFLADGSRLSRTGQHLPAGTEIEVGNPCVMYYDHREQAVVPLLSQEDVYVIVDEIMPPLGITSEGTME